jgi:hypothetical protein
MADFLFEVIRGSGPVCVCVCVCVCRGGDGGAALQPKAKSPPGGAQLP